MDFGKIIERVKAILTTPRTEWPVIAGEQATVSSLYTRYIVLVSALPALAAFIKSSMIGTSVMGITIRVPFGAGLASMLLTYALTLVLVYVMALIIDALAPTFDGQKNINQALKTVAYAWTAGWVAGVAVIVPWIGWMVALAGVIYGIYLLYIGLPETMKCPPEKAAGYTALSILIAFVLSFIINFVVASAVGIGSINSAIKMGQSNSVSVDSNSPFGELAAIGRRAEQASKELAAAQRSGDTDAQAAAMNKMVGAMVGGDGAVEALAPDQIKSFLPERVNAFKRISASSERSNAMGMQISNASARYENSDNQQFTVEVTDTGGAKGLMSLATAVSQSHESETANGYEKTYTANGRLVQESWDRQSNYGEYSVLVGGRFAVKAQGNAGSIDDLKRAVASVDLKKLESLRGAGTQ